MRWIAIFSIMLSLTVVTTHRVAAENFYYQYNSMDSVLLTIDSSRITVRFDNGLSDSARTALIAGVGRIAAIVQDDQAVDDFTVCTLLESSNYDQFLDSMRLVKGVYLVEPYLRDSSGESRLVGTRFCAAFFDTIPSSVVDSICNAHGVVIDHELYGMTNVFLMRNTDSSGLLLLESANLFHEMVETRYAAPDFRIISLMSTYKLYDYYHANQPHIKKVIGHFNDSSVWDFAGLLRPVTVAVIDDGVDQYMPYEHEDLPPARVLSGYDFADGDSNPTPPPRRAHGMGCAGLIAASHTTDSVGGLTDSSGMISINPNALILPVKIFQDDEPDGAYYSDAAEGVSYSWQNGAQVLSVSWGWFGRDIPPGWVIEAFDSAFAYGRDGLGCVIVGATGNTADLGQPGVHYPAAMSSCLAVGALKLDDSRWEYSCYGDSLDLMAPSGETCLQGDVWTLDRMDVAGYNPYITMACSVSVSWDCNPWPWNYNCHFGGTSAACPIVSGVASLLLSRDSTLTAVEVHEILKLSAVTELADTIMPPHPEYGWGRVDAFRAVLSISHGNIDNSIDLYIDISDLVYFLDYMFTDGPPPFPSILLADLDCSGGVIDISDLVWLVDYMYRGGPQPINPCYEFE